MATSLRFHSVLALAVALSLFVPACEGGPVPDPVDLPPDNNNGTMVLPNPYVVLTTSLGDIELELFENETPNTVANFVQLVQEGFYDGIRFHRVIDGFMIQGGCPHTRGGIDPDDPMRRPGTGGPGYMFADEFANQTGPPHRTFDRAGLLAMANAGAHTNGSQFFITLGPVERLNGKHTIFGQVTGGMDVVRAIGRVPTDADDRPREDVVIQTASVTQKRNHVYRVTLE